MLDPAADTLPKCLFRNAERTPDAVAVRRKALGIWRRVTWREAARTVERIAAGLLASDLGDEPCLAAIGDNEPELFWAELAVQAAGRAMSCQYPDLQAADLGANLRDCGARVVFAEDQEQCDKLLSLADGLALRLIVVWDGRGLDGYNDPRILTLDALLARGDALLARDPDAVRRRMAGGRADDLAVVIYTSGTTGRAKGVRGSHRYLLDIADRWRRVLGIRAGSNYVSYISPAWATEQYLGLALGVALPMVVNFPEEPETVTEDMREIGPEFLFFSPRQWEGVVSSTESRMRDAAPPVRAVYRWGMRTLRENPSGWKRRLADLLVGRAVRDRLGFGALKVAVNSGSILSPEVFAFFGALGVPLRNVYGFTEVGIVTATGDGDPHDTLGRPLTSAFGETPLELRIAADEIQARGGVPFGGYHGAAEASAERFTADGWVRSGDGGRFDEHGRLVYLDRLEDLRRLAGGDTVAPQNVETRLRLSPYIRDVIVVCDGRPAPGALVDIDMDMVGKWAEERRIAFTSQVDLSQHPDVVALVGAEIAAVNRTLPQNCRVGRFLNLFKPFDADEGELTHSRKLRRAVVERKYAALVDGLYSGEPAVEASIEMRYQDGRSRHLAARVTIGTAETGAPHAEPRGNAAVDTRRSSAGS